MADTKKGKNTESKEISDILDQLSETDKPQSQSKPAEKEEEIIKKPTGSIDEPEDIEGMLEKISEKPREKPGFFQKLLSFFKKS